MLALASEARGTARLAGRERSHMESTSALARLNDGLIAFAAVLALMVLVVAFEQRLPEIALLFQPMDPQMGTSMLAY